MSKTVTGVQLAKQVGVDKATISRLTKAGILNRDRNGRYDLAANRDAWIRHEQNKQQGQKIVTAQGVLRAQLLEQNIRAKKLENDLAEKNVFKADEVRREVSRAFVAVRNRLLPLGRVCAPLCAGMSPPEIEKIVNVEVNKALTELSENAWVSKT